MFEKYERKVYSQNGEDGVLEKLVNDLELGKKFVVEINTSGKFYDAMNLTANLKWNGICFSAVTDFEKVNRDCAAHYANILIIDVDGLDFYFWREFTAPILPEVIMIEYNSSLGLADKVMPYDARYFWDGSDYFGASITALNHLGKDKGYKLLYADLTGSNLFFVRNEHANKFKSITVKEIYRPPTYGDNGHPPDKLNREYWPYEKAIKVIDKVTRVDELKG